MTKKRKIIIAVMVCIVLVGAGIGIWQLIAMDQRHSEAERKNYEEAYVFVPEARELADIYYESPGYWDSIGVGRPTLEALLEYIGETIGIPPPELEDGKGAVKTYLDYVEAHIKPRNRAY